MKNHTFTFMGTGAGCGVPAFFCDCPACEEARANPRARRGDCGAMVTGTTRTLIDTPPDIRGYLDREGVRYIDDLIYTHWHFDHVGGLGELEYMVQLLTKKPVPTYASPYTLESIGREFEYMMYCLARCEWQPFEELELDGVRYTALPVTHAPGTYGYLIETDDTRLFYACDTGKLPDEKIADIVCQAFDFRPAAIIRDLQLRRPIYRKTAAYGHFGREDADFTWENTDRAEHLRTLAGL